MRKNENPDYLSKQILTYLGNKRLLLNEINQVVVEIKKQLGKEKVRCVDLFSGSGIVARLLKQHSSVLHVNDMEKYSYVINKCYLANSEEVDKENLKHYVDLLNKMVEEKQFEGIIRKNYAPFSEQNIKQSDRVFYTINNAIRIDT